MASQENNIIKIKGNIGGLSFYQLNGKSIVRKSYGPSKETIQNNPAYKKLKNNNSEFAGATFMSKTIRLGLAEQSKQFQDTYMASRLTGACRTIIKNGDGETGKRKGNLLKMPKLLIGFPLIKNQPFTNRCSSKYKIQTPTNNRNQVTLSIPKINKTHFNQIPAGATHFKISLSIAIVSNYIFNTNTSKYQPVVKENNGYGACKSTILLPLNQTNSDISISLPTTNSSPITSQQAITVWLAISFFNKSNQRSNQIISGRAMQCVAVL